MLGVKSKPAILPAAVVLYGGGLDLSSRKEFHYHSFLWIPVQDRKDGLI